MEEYYIMDENFRLVYPLDTYTALIWTDRYYQCGDFEITTPFQVDLYHLFQLDTFIWNPNSKHLMMIETVSLTTDANTGNTLKISGRSTEGAMLDRRIVWDRELTISGNFQNEIEKILNKNVINPADPNRKIPNIRFKRSTDPAITNLYISKQEVGETVYETIETLCRAASVGFRMSLANDFMLEFELYAGVDRSLDQLHRAGVIFSPEYGNLINSSFTNSHTDYRNVALVSGEGEGAEQKFQVAGNESLSGLQRREMYVDGTDLSSLIESENEDEDIEDKVYGQSITEQIDNYKNQLNTAKKRKEEIAKERKELNEKIAELNKQLSDPEITEANYYNYKLELGNAQRSLVELQEEESSDIDPMIPFYESKIKELEGELGNVTPGSDDDTREGYYAEKIALENEREANKARIEALRSQLPDLYKDRVDAKNELDQAEKKLSDAKRNLPKTEEENAKLKAESSEMSLELPTLFDRLNKIQKQIDDYESQTGVDVSDALVDSLKKEKKQKEDRLKVIEAELKELEHPENPKKPGTTTNTFDHSSIYKEYASYLDKKASAQERMDRYEKELDEKMDQLVLIEEQLASETEGTLAHDKLKLEKIKLEKEISDLSENYEKEEENLLEYEAQLASLQKQLDKLTSGSQEKKREELYKEQYELELRVQEIEERLKELGEVHSDLYEEKVSLKTKIETYQSNIINNQKRILENEEKIEKYQVTIMELTPKVEELVRYVNQLNSQIANQEGDAYVADIEREIGNLKVRNQDIERRIEELELMIDTMENPPTGEAPKKYLTDEQYRALLSQRGLEKLAEHRTTLMFDGKVEPKIQYVYGEDFTIGDIVQLENEYHMTAKTRIIEYVISQSTEGIEAYPTFAAVT